MTRNLEEASGKLPVQETRTSYKARYHWVSLLNPRQKFIIHKKELYFGGLHDNEIIMLSHHLAKDSTSFNRHYEHYSNLYREEVGILPSIDVMELYRKNY